MNNNILCNSTFLGVGEQVEPNTIQLKEAGKEILTIHADGRITVSEDCKPTETAAEVLQIMRYQWLADIQCAKIRELQERIEALNRGNAAAERILCELTGCESGRDVPDWIVKKNWELTDLAKAYLELVHKHTLAEERINRLEVALNTAWEIIANTSGGEWKQQHPQWQKAAARWRDNEFLPAMLDHKAKEAKP